MPEIDPVKQRQFAVQVTLRLREAGYVAYWAGGCVRDQLLGRGAKDFDVATDAVPAQIRSLFGQRRTLSIGAAFGVVCVLGPRGAGQIEVATFRHDAAYSDGRHPDSVTFCTAEEDARRRDFTINGLFYDPLSDEVIDYVAGREDLRTGIVRAIGDPTARFSEDKLRLLRAVRFAASLGFQLDTETRDAVERMAPQVTVVSAERIAAEMRLMLTDPNRVQAVDLLKCSGLLAAVLPPEVSLGSGDDWQWTEQMLGHLKQPGFPLALATLLIEAANADQCVSVGRHWRLSNHEIDRSSWLVRHCRSLDDAAERYWPDVQALLIHEGIDELLALLTARIAIGRANAADLAFCRERLAWPTDRLNPVPLITGDDLICHGLEPGKSFQRLLKTVRDAQLLGEISSPAEAIEMVDRLAGDQT